MAKQGLDWQPNDSYGTEESDNSGAVNQPIDLSNTILGGTQIAFFEDNIRLIRIVGHVTVRFLAAMAPSRCDVVQRIRFVMENQATGVLTSAGVNLNDTAVAEEGFLAEKRFSLNEPSSTEGRHSETIGRNDYPFCTPWWSEWDVPVRRTFGIPRALVLSTRGFGVLTGDFLGVTAWFRCLVRR